MKVKLKLEEPAGTSGNYAAFPFAALRMPDGRQIDVIDTFRFDDAGKIVEMHAYGGMTNLPPMDPE